MNTFNVVCPVCRHTLTFQTDVTEFWGMIPVLDIGCVEVTRPPTSPEVERHLDEHRKDGSLIDAVRRQHAHYAEFSAGIVERLNPSEVVSR